MIDNITVAQAEKIADYLYPRLKPYLKKRIQVRLVDTDKFGFTIAEKTPVLFLYFKNPTHGADFFREFMVPLTLHHDTQSNAFVIFSIRLEITQAHPLVSNTTIIDQFLKNFEKSVKEGFIPHQRT